MWRMPLSAREPPRFAAFTRYPNPQLNASASRTFPYTGARLNDNLERYTYRVASGKEEGVRLRFG